MAEGKALERKFLDIEKQLGGFNAFVDTFAEDDKEVLPFELSQFERLNIKFETLKEEIFTSRIDEELDNFDAKTNTCNDHIEKLELAHEEKNNNPLAAPVIQNSTYMDDIFSGADDITTAKEIQRQLICLMKEGYLHLYKWSTNSEELLNDVSMENKEFLFNENEELVKTLR
ncbi:hypothetical protein TNIN_406711 [Trichonephila inaurata madagascariensis]|uniref:Uncharacterized protein n=1 Tax=Trichonephila inaurata madagascariensis TaxID=2747483 RepID=A0A8X7C9K3_9ARAC|nr:hypothetical protein TNIN_406711 [Trichonephila inaurata madagascariensis]